MLEALGWVLLTILWAIFCLSRWIKDELDEYESELIYLKKQRIEKKKEQLMLKRELLDKAVKYERIDHKGGKR